MPFAENTIGITCRHLLSIGCSPHSYALRFRTKTHTFLRVLAFCIHVNGVFRNQGQRLSRVALQIGLSASKTPVYRFCVDGENGNDDITASDPVL